MTIRQPWAAAIAHASKRIENRVWPTSHRGTLVIHAGGTLDRAAMRHPALAAVVRDLPLERGAVIAVAKLVGCHEDDGACTPWSMNGHYHFELNDVLPLPLPVPCQGQQQMWFPTPAVLDRIRLQLSDEQAARFLGEEAAL
ncbi:ASCH domain-containing protein [Streptomyces sparsogenes]|uniref:ASCH domain-containing protein n=1 Tax=Streptomyces sparsogenes TaxID=67365 RepID=UPI0033CF2D30